MREKKTGVGEFLTEIIDFHIQTWKKEFVSKEHEEFLKNFAIMANIPEFPNIDYTPEKYIQDMEQEKEKDIEKYKIASAVIFPVDYSFTKIKFTITYEKYLEYVVNVCDEFKFHSLIGVDPRNPKALEIMETAIEDWGFRGLMFSPSTGFSLLNPRVDMMIAKAVEYKIPVIFHDAGMVPRPLKLVSDFWVLDDILDKYHNHLFIFCPFTQMDMSLMRIGFRHRDHLMTDISAFNASDQMMGNSMPGMFKSQTVIMVKEAFGADKLLFASDWPWFEQKAPISEWVKEVKKMKTPIVLKPFGLPNVNDEDKEMILSENAKRILKL